MLNKDIKEGLVAELEFLKTQRQRWLETVDKKIRALEAILAPTDDFGFFQAILPLDRDAQGEKSSSNGDRSNGHGEAVQGKGLRAVMFEVLASCPSGLRAPDIAGKVEASGWKPSGKTSTKTLVWADLYRLKKNGRVTKRGKKWFAPASTP